MRHRCVLAIVLAALTLALLGGSALADTPARGFQGTVSMRGQAVMAGTEANPQLRIKATAGNGTPWLIELALTPSGVTRGRGERDDRGGRSGGIQITNLRGSFTLGIPQFPAAAGTAGGSINTNGSGNIKLSDTANAVLLDMPFMLRSDGTFTAEVQGQWPVVPGAEAVSAPQPPVLAPQTAPVDPINHSFWYLSRTSGIVAYFLLFLSVCLGLVLKTKFTNRTLGRWQVLDLHQFLVLLAMVLLAVHVFALLGDKYFNYTLKQLLLPGDGPYRPAWIGVGIAATYGTLAVTLSSYLKKLIPHRLWRLLHCTAAGLFLAIFLHSFYSGTDSSAPWAQWMYISTGSIVVFLFLWRFQQSVFGWLEPKRAESRQ